MSRLRASSGSEAAGPEAAAGWAACVSLAARRSPRGPLPASRLMGGRPLAAAAGATGVGSGFFARNSLMLVGAAEGVRSEVIAWLAFDKAQYSA